MQDCAPASLTATLTSNNMLVSAAPLTDLDPCLLQWFIALRLLPASRPGEKTEVD